MNDPRARLQAARLYLVCGDQGDAFLRTVLSSGVDVVQLRMKDADDEEVLAAAVRFRRACREHGALFLLNDRPDLAVTAGADGVHLGQDDIAVPAARQVVGPECLIGLSTHTPKQIDQAAGVDYIGVGPVHETPTKPGRPAVGLDLVRYAASHATVPFFAIGGLTPANVATVCDAGASRIAVVRALTEATAPDQAARTLREALTQGEVAVGTT